MADAMLGRLARWLRLLGFDTLYYPHGSDADLLKAAIREDRVILTRDTRFPRIKNLKDFLLIKSNDPIEQVKEVISLYPRELKASRCARCNGVLDSVAEKEEIRDRVPEHVFFGRGNFMRCGSCGNVYWEGTHLKRFREMLYTLLGKANL